MTITFDASLIPVVITMVSVVVAWIISERTPSGRWGEGGIAIIAAWGAALIVSLFAWLVWALALAFL